MFTLTGIDQITKLWAVNALKGQEAISLIPGVFEFSYLENKGAAFGIFQDKQWLFLGAGIIIMVVLVIFFTRVPKKRENLPLLITMVVVASGAVGNMIDRTCYGYVIDFLYFSLIDFPAFNVADIYVSVGTAVLAVLILFYYKDEDLERMLPKKERKAS